MAATSRIALTATAARVLPDLMFMDLQSCSSVKVNELGLIILCFGQWNAKAQLNRPEWRFPSNTYTGRRPEGEVISDATVNGASGLIINLAQSAKVSE